LGGRTWLLRRLAVKEEAMYRQIPPPDHVVLLRLRPEVALERKGNRDPASVVAKAAALGGLAGTGVRVIEIDAEQALDAVEKDVRAALWQIL
jgi:thymidylate kinase